MILKSLIEKIIAYIPYVGKWRAVFLQHSDPGHFYSPIPNKNEIKAQESLIFNKDKTLMQIDLQLNKQISLLRQFESRNIDLKNEIHNKFKYYNEDNIYYRFHDAVSFFMIALEAKPKRIVEIGSGYSSCFMLDMNENYFNNSINLQFVEPFPEERLNLLLAEGTEFNCQIYQNKIQEIPLEFFSELEENDILFVDSSHVSKVGSDLNHIIFEILPRLKSGVIIHFHDIHYPFEYPKEWIYKGFAWNENYVLRAFLMYNSSFEILYMNSYMYWKEKSLYDEVFQPPYEFQNDISGCIFLVKK